MLSDQDPEDVAIFLGFAFLAAVAAAAAIIFCN